MLKWSGENVLVTGSSGFIGTNLLDALSRAGAGKVVGVDRALPRVQPGPAVHFVRADVRQGDEIERVIKELAPTVVFHLAARTDLRDSSLDDYDSNTAGTAILLRSLESLSESVRLVVTSSRLVCPTGYVPAHDEDYAPDTIYGASKVEQERMVRRSSPRNVAWVIARLTSIWGPHFGVPYRGFFEAIGRGLYMHPRGVRIRKSMGYVENTVLQLMALATTADGPSMGRTLTVCDYDPLEVYHWAGLISKEMGSQVREVPPAWLKAAARSGDLLERVGVRNPPLTSFRLANLLTEMVYPTDELAETVGPIPFDLRTGVCRTVRWFNASA